MPTRSSATRATRLRQTQSQETQHSIPRRMPGRMLGRTRSIRRKRTWPVITSCGDRIVAGEELCDDGHVCAVDGCDRCLPESTLVLTRFAIVAGSGFDVDDADGDGDRSTGIDNRPAEPAIFSASLTAFVADFVSRGALLQLVTFGTADAADEVAIAIHPGQAPTCPAMMPMSWLGTPGSPMHSTASAFDGCTPAAGRRPSTIPVRRCLLHWPCPVIVMP